MKIRRALVALLLTLTVGLPVAACGPDEEPDPTLSECLEQNKGLGC